MHITSDTKRNNSMYCFDFSQWKIEDICHAHKRLGQPEYGGTMMDIDH